jgi:hypothetical protein
MENRMRTRTIRVVLLTGLTIWLMARPARADGLITPFVGADFGGDAGDCRGVTPCVSKQLTYGVGAGFMVGGMLGLEAEIAYAPRFFGDRRTRADEHTEAAAAADDALRKGRTWRFRASRCEGGEAPAGEGVPVHRDR